MDRSTRTNMRTTLRCLSRKPLLSKPLFEFPKSAGAIISQSAITLTEKACSQPKTCGSFGQVARHPRKCDGPAHPRLAVDQYVPNMVECADWWILYSASWVFVDWLTILCAWQDLGEIEVGLGLSVIDVKNAASACNSNGTSFTECTDDVAKISAQLSKISAHVTAASTDCNPTAGTGCAFNLGNLVMNDAHTETDRQTDTHARAYIRTYTHSS